MKRLTVKAREPRAPRVILVLSSRYFWRYPALFLASSRVIAIHTPLVWHLGGFFDLSIQAPHYIPMSGVLAPDESEDLELMR